MSKKNEINTVSVVLFTYTGIDTISRCLESILGQKISSAKIETIVVIDGPSKTMYDIVSSFKKLFSNKEMVFKMHQFNKNRGRYVASAKGVELASGQWLLIVGDRVLLPTGYIDKAFKLHENVIIPHTVDENWEKSPINKTLHLIRNRIYSRKGLRSFSQYLDNESFEKSAKGTGGLFIKKELFLQARRNMGTSGSAEKYVSEDTRLLKEIINLGEKPLLTDKIHIVYIPRKGFMSQISHIYQRGPMFVNYYIRKSARFRPHLIILCTFSILAIIAIVINPFSIVWLGILLAGIIAISDFYFAQSFSDFLLLLWTLPIVGLSFYIGLVKGLVIHLAYGKN